MKNGGPLLLPGLMVAIAGCAAQEGDLQVRPSKDALSAIARPVSQRIAEANGQLALGNIALALDGYRRASREDPTSIDALSGLAICYDHMGRYDLSRRYHEAALAVAPGEPRLLNLLADSLTLQGRTQEAQRVRQEIASRAASATVLAGSAPSAKLVEVAAAKALQSAAAREAIEPLGAAPTQLAWAPHRSVTVDLPPARSMAPRSAAPLAPTASGRTAEPALPALGPAPRLERLSSGEVALVTGGAPLWRVEKVAATARTTTIRFVPLRQAPAASNVRLLNAARVDRLAARTRAWLSARGWGKMTIGDAAAARSTSLILYPAAQRAVARRLSSHLGFAMAERATGAHVTVILGKDAARSPRS